MAKKRYRSKVLSNNESTGFDLKSLLLLYDAPNEQAFKHFEILKTELGISEDNFNAVCCGINNEFPVERIAFVFEDIAYNGKLKNEALKDMITSGPDLVINYTEKGNPEAAFLLKLTAAPIKAGRFDEKEINLSINDGNDPEVFVKELIRYLKILKGNK
ncbi:MAG TPA: hypothetical protein VLO29_02805 [Salegentibacter sp.]|nr:hypothetical protein [Salegentibacter sp.]